MSTVAPKLFISYRREETAGHAGRTYDAMTDRFGEPNVFMDVGIAPGVNFVKQIKEAVAECSALVAVIGPTWATLTDDEGGVRLADPDDFVRLEVETALRNPGVTVIPVLVAGARMPDADDLPGGIRELAYRNAIELSDLRWRYDVGQLMNALERLVSFPRMDAPSVASGSDLAEGVSFAGYRIEGVAGRGGMGVVYRATQLALDRPVALKLIAPELAEDRDFRERFKRESQMAASIEHPHVIPVYEAGESGERLFISMRYIDGSDLRKLIREDCLAPARAVGVVVQVGAALDAAHRRGLVHRDVKPANILIAGEDGDHAYLTDFGLTKRTTSAGGLTATGQFVGTADYTAPEQIMGKPTDARTDVYALGCVLYHALTGKTVYQRDSEVAVMYAHLHDPPPRLTEADPDLPDALNEVIDRAMAKEPEDRYPSAGDLGRAAAAAATGGGTDLREGSVATGAAVTGVTTAPPGSDPTAPTVRDPPEPRRQRGERQPTRPGRLALLALAGVACVAVAVLVGRGAFERDEQNVSATGPAPATASNALQTFQAGSSVQDVSARANRLVAERKVAGGVRLTEFTRDGMKDLPPSPAYNYAGMELGSDSVGRQVLIYSRCTGPRYTCQLYLYRFDIERSELVRGVSMKGCDEYGPSISAGTISFSRGWRTSICEGGVFLQRPGRPATRLAGHPGSTDVSETVVAWDTSPEGRELTLARVDRPTSTRRKIVPPRATAGGVRPAFSRPVLGGAYLYFVERVADDRYVIARTGVRGARTVRRYRLSFTDAPVFAIQDGGLIFSGNARAQEASGDDVIVADEKPAFE